MTTMNISARDLKKGDRIHVPLPPGGKAVSRESGREVTSEPTTAGGSVAVTTLSGGGDRRAEVFAAGAGMVVSRS